VTRQEHDHGTKTDLLVWIKTDFMGLLRTIQKTG